MKESALKLKLEAMDAYGGKRCACSGCPLPIPGIDFLSIDHIENDGAQHGRAIGQARRNIYRWLKQQGYPAGFQVLCFNCNMGKNVNGGICPHLAVAEPVL
jgi:hypothetical protein